MNPFTINKCILWMTTSNDTYIWNCTWLGLRSCLLGHSCHSFYEYRKIPSFHILEILDASISRDGSDCSVWQKNPGPVVVCYLISLHRFRTEAYWDLCLLHQMNSSFTIEISKLFSITILHNKVSIADYLWLLLLYC